MVANLHQTVISCPFSVVIPAAGASKRLGQAKQLIQMNGQTLLARVVNNAATLAASEIIVITGATAEKLPTEHELNQDSQIPVRMIVNPQWAKGLGTSIALGTRSVDDESQGLMILLCDQWRIEATDLQSLMQAWLRDTSRIVAASGESTTGPPVIFPRLCFASLSQLQGDSGARKVLHEYAELLQTVPIEHAAADLDTPADLDKLRAFLKRK